MHNKFCNPPLQPLPILIFLTQKKNCNFYFFHILLSWENIIGGNTIVILLVLWTLELVGPSLTHEPT